MAAIDMDNILINGGDDNDDELLFGADSEKSDSDSDSSDSDSDEEEEEVEEEDEDEEEDEEEVEEVVEEVEDEKEDEKEDDNEEEEEVVVEKVLCHGKKKNGDSCNFKPKKNNGGFCKIHTPKIVDSDDEVMEPKVVAVKVVAGKCGGVKKDGEPCMFKACEDGFCKRHSPGKVVSPKVKAAKMVKEVRDWGEWEDVDSDCEEDPDFDYQYEEVWVEC